MTTKAELEQRLTEKQSECIEGVLRHDAVEAERDQWRGVALLGLFLVFSSLVAGVW